MTDIFGPNIADFWFFCLGYGTGKCRSNINISSWTVPNMGFGVCYMSQIWPRSQKVLFDMSAMRDRGGPKVPQKMMIWVQAATFAQNQSCQIISSLNVRKRKLQIWSKFESNILGFLGEAVVHSIVCLHCLCQGCLGHSVFWEERGSCDSLGWNYRRTTAWQMETHGADHRDSSVPTQRCWSRCKSAGASEGQSAGMTKTGETRTARDADHWP